MKDCREQWYDAAAKVAVTIADVTGPAQELARGHLSGPVSAHYLAKALAAVSLLGAETEAADETVILQLKCEGPLGGVNVECTASGTLRGYAEKKVLDDFDGLGAPDDRKVLGARQVQVTRSVPGRILSQGLSNSLDGYLAGSLQRKACVFLEAAVTDEVEVLEARGVMVEALPDSSWSVSEGTAALEEALHPRKGAARSGALAVSSRSLLEKLGLSRAGLRKSTPLAFACRCSPERAQAMLSALGERERAELPPTLDVTCHMCGRTYVVRTK